MNSQAINDFVRSVSQFGPVRAKTLRDGQEVRLQNASVETDQDSVLIKNDTDHISIDLTQVEHISYSPEKQKYFVHTTNGLVEVRPDVQ